MKAVSGYILEVKDDYFTILTENGDQFSISYSPCTKSLSNRENYALTPGDIIILKGIPDQTQSNKMKATQLTCIKKWFWELLFKKFMNTKIIYQTIYIIEIIYKWYLLKLI